MDNTLSKSSELRSGFLPGRHGHLHVVQYLPWSGDERKSIVIVPPFAEEMNKCRRMMHLLGVRLAELGFSAVIPDLSGTGDSEGQFSDATWQAWLDDVDTVRDWIDQQGDLVAMVGIRLGALLVASHHARRIVPQMIFWQPVSEGPRQLREFLRLRLLADQFDGGESPLRPDRELEQGRPVDVAGYRLSATLAEGLREQRLFAHLRNAPTRIDWIQISSGPEAACNAGDQAGISDLRQRGADVSVLQVTGSRFWMTQETSVAPGLLDETERLLQP